MQVVQEEVLQVQVVLQVLGVQEDVNYHELVLLLLDDLDLVVQLVVYQDYLEQVVLDVHMDYDVDVRLDSFLLLVQHWRHVNDYVIFLPSLLVIENVNEINVKIF